MTTTSAGTDLAAREDDARRIADALVLRHAGAERSPERAPDAARLAGDLATAMQALRQHAPELAPSALAELEGRQAVFLETHADRLLVRAGAGRVLANAVSLRATDVRLDEAGVAHVEPGGESAAAAAGDVCVELAGLTVDWLAADLVTSAESLLSQYAQEACDFSIYEVIDFHERACALERAASAARTASRHGASSPERRDLLRSSRHLVELALATERRTRRPPFVVVFGGLVASGKSTLARALADRLATPRIMTDRLREVTFGPGPGRDVHEARWAESFAPGARERVYGELLGCAEQALASGRPVVLDGCFPHPSDRAAARALARRHGAPFRFVECGIAPELQAARLAERERAEEHGGWPEIARELASHWQPPEELAEEERVLLDTARTLAENLAILDTHLPAWADPSHPRPTRARLPDAPAAVTFDCWQTLLCETDWEQAHARRVHALVEAAASAGRSVSHAAARAAFDAAWSHHMICWKDGIATGAEDVARLALGVLGIGEPHTALESLVAAYQEASHSSRVVALAGARETLAALARAGIRCALVCDTGLTPGRVVRRHLARAGLLQYLEVCAFSDEIGVPKPDPRIFRAALRPLDVRPENAVHVGDLRRTDVAGARALGMGAVRIRAQHDDLSALPEADAVADTHAHLRELLGRA
jgi:FMN phosphatase YigB (HAD superfamily)/predicted kinase